MQLRELIGLVWFRARAQALDFPAHPLDIRVVEMFEPDQRIAGLANAHELVELAHEFIRAGKFPEAGRYPFNSTPNDGALVNAIAGKFGVKAENVVLGAGSGEILTNSVRAFTSSSRPLVTAWPSFENPHTTAQKIGTPIKEVPLDAQLRIDIPKMVAAVKGAGLVFFCNPNNPTATVHGHQAVADFVKAVRQESPETVILLDEAYHDYVTDPSYKSGVDLAMSTSNVFVARTFSKAYGLAGLRIGVVIGHRQVLDPVRAVTLPFNINGVALAALGAALQDRDFLPRYAAQVEESRERLEWAVDIRFRLFGALWQLGELHQQVEALRQADALARALGDRRRQGRVASNISFCYWTVSESEKAIEAGIMPRPEWHLGIHYDNFESDREVAGKPVPVKPEFSFCRSARAR